MPRDLKPCGTPAAYRRHLRYGEEPCDMCREAEHERRHPGQPRHGPAKCGTRSGYSRHRRLKQVPCAACRRANAREANRGRMARSARADVPHGYGGYVNWDCRCPVCTEANTQHSSAYRAGLRQAAGR